MPVGNDIVNLSDPLNRGKSRDRRFLEKVFTPRERDDLRASGHAERALWALWAGKETAYKALSGLFPGIPAVPRLYCVTLDSPPPSHGLEEAVRGRVETPGGSVAIRVLFREDHLHCVGAAGDEGRLMRVLAGVTRREDAGGGNRADSESFLVREAARRHLARCFGWGEGDIEIACPDGGPGPGPPAVFHRGRRADVGLSLSHDGPFLAWAILPPAAAAKGSPAP